MGKFLILTVAILVFYWWLRRPSSPEPGDRHRSASKGEMMVRCEYCGLHVPSGEATSHEGVWFCCEDHRARATKSRAG